MQDKRVSAKNIKVVRFGISIPEDLISAFDRYADKRNYASRSEAIRDIIREKLIEEKWESDTGERPLIGVITYLFDHHHPELVTSLIDLQHFYTDQVIASQHVHLDHHYCLETVIAKGRSSELRGLAYKLKALKGVKHCRLTMTTSNFELG